MSQDLFTGRRGCPGGGQGAAVPSLDDVARDRHPRRQGQLAGLQRGQQVGAAPPAGLGQLLVVDHDDLARGRLGPETEHQAARHRPGLAGHVADVGDRDPGLLGHLADHGLLGRLPGLHESGQDRDPAAGPSRVASQQAPVLRVGDQHDHRRVGAREVLAAVRGTRGRMAGRVGHRGRAVERAANVRVVPVGQGHRVGEQPRVAVGQQRPDLPQRRDPDAVPTSRQRAAHPEVDHAVGVLAEQEPGPGRRLLRRHEDQLVVPDQRLTLVNHEETGARVLPGRIDPVLVRPPLGHPVDRAAGQREPAQRSRPGQLRRCWPGGATPRNLPVRFAP